MSIPRATRSSDLPACQAREVVARIGTLDAAAQRRYFESSRLTKRPAGRVSSQFLAFTMPFHGRGVVMFIRKEGG
jgi:hypothetical protein